MFEAMATRIAQSVLLVDDDELDLQLGRRALVRGGYNVETACDGQAALELSDKRPFDVIVSDINMPGIDGLRLLRALRARACDVPVILQTGAPDIETAIKAVEDGAVLYLRKPVLPNALVAAVAQATARQRVDNLERATRSMLVRQGVELTDLNSLDEVFDRALSKLTMAYQPIVSWMKRRVVAYEALVRSSNATLPHPGALLAAAECLGRVHDLGRAVRRRVHDDLCRRNPMAQVFVNLHPDDLDDPQLYDASAPLTAFADMVVLEVTERASLEGKATIRDRLGRLRRLGYEIALDDLGAGYAGLSSFALLRPDVLKIDMSLVQGIERDPTKQRIVRSMLELVAGTDQRVIVEGVETAAERDALASLGADLMQGFLFARPGRPYPAAAGLDWATPDHCCPLKAS